MLLSGRDEAVAGNGVDAMRVHVPLILGSRADENGTSSCVSAVHELGGIEWDARWKKRARSWLDGDSRYYCIRHQPV